MNISQFSPTDGSDSSMYTPPREEVGFQPVALVASLLLPGAGHIARGERVRGLAAGAGILGLFFGGLLLGGIDVVDSKEDRFWFFGQALIGPIAFGVDAYHQNSLKVVEKTRAGRPVYRTAYPTEGRDPKTGAPIPGGKPPNTKSISKVNELGMLSCCIAGMLNVIVIIDAGWPTRRRAGGTA